MISRVYEAEIYFGKKKLAITNTEYEISVEWSLKYEEVEGALEFKIFFKRIFGKFNYREKHEEYTAKVEIQFDTSTNWSYKWTTDSTMSRFFEKKTEARIYPESIVIDFDNKTARICL